MPRCVIPGCKRRHSSTHFFPKDPRRRQQWIDFVKCIDPNFELKSANSCICGAHFETKYYNFNFWLDKTELSKGQRRTLSEEAIPTLVGEPLSPGRAMLPAETSVHTETTGTIQNTTTMLTTSIPFKLVTVAEDGTPKNNNIAEGQKQICILRNIAPKTSSLVQQSPTVVSLPVSKITGSTLNFVRSVASGQSTINSPVAAKSVQKVMPNLQTQAPKFLLIPSKAPASLVQRKGQPSIVADGSKKILKLKADGSMAPPCATKKAPRKMLVKKTILSKEDVMLVPNAAQSVRERRFTCDELKRLNKSDLVHLFARRVKILSSNNFALRCQLLKSCRFIISCKSEADCISVMHMHMSKHISNLNGETTVIVSTPDQDGGDSSTAAGEGNFEVSKAPVFVSTTNSAAIRQYVDILGTHTQIEKQPKPVKFLPNPVKLVPKTNIPYTAANSRRMPTENHAFTTCGLGVTPHQNSAAVSQNSNQPQLNNSEPKQPLNDPKLYTGAVLSDSQSIVPKTSSPQTVSSTGHSPTSLTQTVSSAAHDPSSLQVSMESAVSHNEMEAPTMTMQPIVIPLHKPKLLPNASNPVQNSGEDSSAIQNMTLVLLPLTKLTNQGDVATTARDKKRHGALRQKEVEPLVKNRLTSHVTELYERDSNVTKEISAEEVNSPLAVANQMILKAKTLLDKNTSKPVDSPGDVGAFESQAIPERETNSPPPFEIKITPPRLHDLARHVIMSNPLFSGIDLQQVLSQLESRNSIASSARSSPVVKSEPLDEVDAFPHDSSSPNGLASKSPVKMNTSDVRNEQDDTDDILAEKESFLAALGLEKADLVKSKKKRKRTHTPWTRFRKRKFARLGPSPSDKYSYAKRAEALLTPGLKSSSGNSRSSTDSGSYNLKRAGALKRKAQNEIHWKGHDSKMPGHLGSATQGWPANNSERLKNAEKWNTKSRNENRYDILQGLNGKQKSSVTLPLEKIVPPGMFVLKRHHASIPNRVLKNATPEKKNSVQKYREITVNGKVVKIKQEPKSDDEQTRSRTVIRLRSKKPKKTGDEMLQPPSDDDSDLFWDITEEGKVGEESKADSTDSENESDEEYGNMADKSDQSVRACASDPAKVTLTSVGGRITQDSAAIRERAWVYVGRLRELIEMRKKVISIGGRWPDMPQCYRKCRLCSQEFSELGDMYIHYRIHAGERCSSSADMVGDCDFTSNPRTKQSCLSLQVKECIKPKPEKEHICLHCGRKFRSDYLLKEHTYVHGSAEPFKCNICYHRFKTMQLLIVHSKKEHDCKPISLASDDAFNYEPSRSSFSDNNPVQKVAASESTQPQKQAAVPVFHSSSSSQASTALSTASANLVKVVEKVKRSRKVAAPPSSGPSDILECHSPPLPATPPPASRDDGARTANILPTPNGFLYLQPVPMPPNLTTSSSSKAKPHPTSILLKGAPSTSGMQSIKLTLFPKDSNGLSRVCFAKSGKLG